MLNNKHQLGALLALLLSAQIANAAPRAAVARVVVQERGAVSYGSGTLIDSREAYGLVVTNWHVVRDATGKIEVVFPDGFRSQARAIKLDEDWDLAALVIWRPKVEPVSIAPRPPRPGEALTICGYGQGDYREATGRCTDFYAPEVGLPHELVELSVEARQGDSGGPILNSQGELAGVLFGAGQGTTLGSFAPRVETFLATLAPDIGQPPHHDALPATPALIAQAPPQSDIRASSDNCQRWDSLDGPKELTTCEDSDDFCKQGGQSLARNPTQQPCFASSQGDAFSPWSASSKPAKQQPVEPTAERSPVTMVSLDADSAEIPMPVDMPLWFNAARDLFAVLGLAFLFLQLVKAAA